MLGFTSIAQDVQFTQFYANPVHLNPGFVGSSHHNRASFQNRIQWPKLDSKYVTYFASADKFLPQYNSGFGVMVLHDRVGSAAIVETGGWLQYSYELHLTRNLTVRPGLQGGYVTRGQDFSNLDFPSQFEDDDFTFSGEAPLQGSRMNFWDFGTGAILYSSNMWMAYSWNHINQPNQSIVNQNSALPRKHTIVGGYKIWLKKPNKMTFNSHPKDISITPTFHYKSQGKSDQFDLGVYGRYDHLLVGIWYRGIPFKRLEDIQNNEALTFSAGWRYHQYTIYYSYDKTLSTLNPIGAGGAHEINFTFIGYHKYKKRKPMKRIPCPNLYKH